jgi:Rieske Fe-S protein
MRKKMNRREFAHFMKSFWLKAMGLMLPAAAFNHLLKTPTRSDNQKLLVIKDYPDLENVGGYVTFNDPASFIIMRTGEADFMALSLTCTHAGCPVNWISSSAIFSCPCHGSQYDKNGKRIAGPAQRDLTPYNTEYRSETGEVIVYF